jgi:hypothetical protein
MCQIKYNLYENPTISLDGLKQHVFIGTQFPKPLSMYVTVQGSLDMANFHYTATRIHFTINLHNIFSM